METLIWIGLAFGGGVALRSSVVQHGPGAAPVNAYLFHLALPALAFRELQQAQWSLTLLWLPVLWLGLFGVNALAATALARRLGWSRGTTGALVLTTGLGSASFIGLPMVQALQGAEALPYGVMHAQLGSVPAICVLGALAARAFATPATAQGCGMLDALTRSSLPLLATAAGALVPPAVVPHWMDQGLAMLATTLGPVAMFAAGLQLRLEGLTKLLRPLGTGLLLKLLFAPALLGALVLPWGALSPVELHTTVLQLATPPAALAVAFASRHQLAPQLAALMVAVGTPASLLTLPLWSWAMALGGISAS